MRARNRCNRRSHEQCACYDLLKDSHPSEDVVWAHERRLPHMKRLSTTCDSLASDPKVHTSYAGSTPTGPLSPHRVCGSIFRMRPAARRPRHDLARSSQPPIREGSAGSSLHAHSRSSARTTPCEVHAFLVTEDLPDRAARARRRLGVPLQQRHRSSRSCRLRHLRSVAHSRPRASSVNSGGFEGGDSVRVRPGWC